MELDRRTLAQARRAVRQAVSGYLYDPNVSMIDFGFPEHQGEIHTEELAIRIHVQRKMYGAQLEAAVEAGRTLPLPESIGGFPVDVPQGAYHVHPAALRPAAPVTRSRRVDPLQGGISISPTRLVSYATLGALVRDRASGAKMILSNWHVLAGDWLARPGQPIVQPGRLDGGWVTDRVATLTRHSMPQNLDAAVAKLTGERDLINNQVGLGPIRGVLAPELGQEVVKSGRRTGITHGMVTSIEGVARIRYGWIDRVIRHVSTIEPLHSGDEVSAPGDSGSAWLEAGSHAAIGLHFAGSDQPERALAMDIQAVLDALGVDLVTGETPAPAVESARERELALV